VSLLYVDSSFLFAIIFAEPKAEEYARIWDNAGTRLSSIVLQVECSVVLHRLCATTSTWRWSEGLLGGVNLQLVDERIAARIRADTSYGHLRSLDTVHLATACEAHAVIGEEIAMACLDRRLREAAASFGLNLLPKTVSEEEHV